MVPSLISLSPFMRKRFLNVKFEYWKRRSVLAAVLYEDI